VGGTGEGDAVCDDVGAVCLDRLDVRRLNFGAAAMSFSPVIAQRQS
jgi:hypothetical protein